MGPVRSRFLTIGVAYSQGTMSCTPRARLECPEVSHFVAARKRTASFVRHDGVAYLTEHVASLQPDVDL